MIKQSAIGLNSRSEANPFNEDGFLPLITAPMYSVVDENNYQVFLDNKVQVCLPRGVDNTIHSNDKFFIAYSLNEFLSEFVTNRQRALGEIKKVCIDTANGNMPALHEAIRKAKEIHGSNLVIMAGNVGSVEAFVELAKTGVDYIRVGIGGGGGCNTTANTGVGQSNLLLLIQDCKEILKELEAVLSGKSIYKEPRFKYYSSDAASDFFVTATNEEAQKAVNVKIIADGISSWIDYCQKTWNYNDNGYAAINELFFAGSDLVMVGKLFAQCVESAGTKRLSEGNEFDWSDGDYKSSIVEGWVERHYYREKLEVKYSGMSTQEEQKKYKEPHIEWKESIVTTPSGHKVPGFKTNGETKYNLKPSEGSVKWIPVRWTLPEWLKGSEEQDKPPYLMGWIHSIKSMKAYTNT